MHNASLSAKAHLLSATGPVAGSTVSLTYDGFGRPRTATYDGRTVTTDYDALDRPTHLTYPDGTSEETTYNRLDPTEHRDRLGRVTRTFYDPLGRPVATRDAEGRTVGQQWSNSGSLDKLKDGSGNTTSWEYDLEGRVTRHVRADGTASILTYESATSRLHQATDARNQVTTYQYFRDGAIKQVDYTNAAVATPSVAYTYDSVYARVSSRTDGTGTTTYAYNPVTAPASLGAGRLASIDGPLANDLITYSYDELGRTTGEAVNGVGASWSFDTLGRVTTTNNALGTFTYGYVGNTTRPASVAYPNGQSTEYSYLGTLADNRLERILHKRPGGSTLSSNSYTYTTTGNIQTWTQQKDANAPTAYSFAYDRADQLTAATLATTDPTPVVLKRFRYAYDAAGNRTSEQIDDASVGAAYNNLNQLTSTQPGGTLSVRGTTSEAATVTVQGKAATTTAGNQFESRAQVASGTTSVAVVATDASGNQRTNTYDVTQAGSSASSTYDANGNLTADGSRTYEWDALDRLVAVNQGANRSEFTYDGAGHRVRIVEKLSGTTTSDRRYLWCGDAICEERDATGGTTSKRFFGNGVQDAGASYFYARDHLGSVRELTDSSGTVRARYDYDSYGRRTKTEGDLDSVFGFTGHFAHATTGLALALYSGYDPGLGRWLSPDPIDIAGGLNLYGYAGNNPIAFTDPLGLWTWKCVALAAGKGLLFGAKMAAAAFLIAAGLVMVGVPVGIVTAIGVGVGVGFGLTGIVSLGWAAQDDRLTADHVAFTAGAVVGGFGVAWGINAALGGGAGGAARAAGEAEALDWSIVSKTGETRVGHVVAEHGAPNLQKPVQGVFYGDPVATTNDAWAIAQSRGIQPVTAGGADIYVVPRPNSGYAAGMSGQGQNLNTVTIVTQAGTPRVITAFPGNGLPLPKP